ncbi:hypothetical protein SAMN05421730_101218 [Anaerobium acetethylicum]|uniref:Uncharacterized protein n=1 Tax=Anaerobium acetethylicum TaxID=1619234 RepID=A0A1D3TU88_9FIRM|nr:hypothetical protein SAMN05421730_101218 [Anaerobium acetethylicum]
MARIRNRLPISRIEKLKELKELKELRYYLQGQRPVWFFCSRLCYNSFGVQSPINYERK